ncbi:uncharacterized protein At5g50100, chloroplastic [Dendrobium catenatum]|uniref:Thiol-disulfide oxidoreductase DCC n=1 Tax=Dendrobium nobile TaxID=94219 RepID=A0A8T3AKL4_DENNO|nr:uncharacterized protein At5g50100, chloroplastic [Dendrobium catenatum]KAI0497076.1 hypothetical protein KFK09_023404 [Dendrobium nobile]
MVFGRAALYRLPLHHSLTHSFIKPSKISHLPCHSPTVPSFQIRAVNSESKLKEMTQSKDEGLSNTWKIKMLYDGECPLCMREVNMLRERNQAYGTIKFVDISSDDYLPEENQGLDYKTVMGKIHAIQSDGTIHTNVEAFRRLYEEVGLGWVYAITKYKPILTITNGIYGIWAAYRLQLTGRPSLEKILESKKKLTERTCNDEKVCKM